jgi:hypothetical protein
MAYYSGKKPSQTTEELLTRTLAQQELDNYREFEDALFNAMRGIKDQGGCSPSFIKKLSGAPLNRLGYLLSILSIPVEFKSDQDAPIVALYWKNDEPEARVNRLDEVASSWRLSKGIELGRWKQFLSTGMC